MHSIVEEGELIRRVRAGERDAFAALAAHHGGSLLRFARLLARDEVMAREMVQDAWLTLLHAVDGFDERASRALDAHARGGRAAGVRSRPRWGSEGHRAARRIHGA